MTDEGGCSTACMIEEVVKELSEIDLSLCNIKSAHGYGVRKICEELFQLRMTLERLTAEVARRE